MQTRPEVAFHHSSSFPSPRCATSAQPTSQPHRCATSAQPTSQPHRCVARRARNLPRNPLVARRARNLPRNPIVARRARNLPRTPSLRDERATYLAAPSLRGERATYLARHRCATSAQPTSHAIVARRARNHLAPPRCATSAQPTSQRRFSPHFQSNLYATTELRIATASRRPFVTHYFSRMLGYGSFRLAKGKTGLQGGPLRNSPTPSLT